MAQPGRLRRPGRGLKSERNQTAANPLISLRIVFRRPEPPLARTDDEVRKDEDEGKYDLHFQGTRQSMFIKQRSGDNSHILCTSYSLNSKLFEKFKVDSCFRIEDPGGFVLAVAKCLPVVGKIHSGPVQYLPQRSARRQFEEKEFMPDIQRLIDVAQQRVEGDLDTVWREVHQDQAKRIGELVSNIPYFAKPLSYVEEAEYRMVWETDRPAPD
jgi:hypothetical protein